MKITDNSSRPIEISRTKRFSKYFRQKLRRVYSIRRSYNPVINSEENDPTLRSKRMKRMKNMIGLLIREIDETKFWNIISYL